MKLFGWAIATYSVSLAFGLLGFGATGVVPVANAAALSDATSLFPKVATGGQFGFSLNASGMNSMYESSIFWKGGAMAATDSRTREGSIQISYRVAAKTSFVTQTAASLRSVPESGALSPAAVVPLQITTTELPTGRAGVPYSAPISVSGGTAPTQWSVAAGSLPSGLAMDSQTGVISGTPASAGTFTFTAYVTDSLDSSSKIDMTITIAPSVVRLAQSASTSAQFYGSALGANSLGNTTLGPNGNMVSYRFRAKNSGVLLQSRIYLIPDHAGYAAGTGGTIRVTLNTDDGTAAHNPGTTVLASYVISNVLSLASPARYFYIMKFASPPTLTAGQLYHMVFKNVDASPTTNYLSVDDLCQKVGTTPGQPTVSDIDSAVLLSQDGGAWSQRKSFSPIYELDFQNGASEGMGYMEAWSGAPQNISGSSAIRETFTVSGSQVNVTSASIRLARINGNGPLTVRLENANGSLIEQGGIPATAIALSTAASPADGWVTFPFSTTYTLIPGQTYHLDLEATATSTYQAFPIRKGSAYGFKTTTFFPDGYAQFKQNNSWVGWTQWGVANRTDGDLQFYFTVAP